MKQTAFEKITQIIQQHKFPLAVLQDVNARLADCQDEHYADQQYRYLQNVVAAGKAKKRDAI